LKACSNRVPLQVRNSHNFGPKQVTFAGALRLRAKSRGQGGNCVLTPSLCLRAVRLLSSAIPIMFLLPRSAHAGAVVSTTPLTRPVINSLRVDHAPKLEDFLQMQPGSNAPAMAKVQNFIEKNPKDGAPAQERTEAYLGYDSRYLYAVFVCFDSNPGRIRGHMARRESIGPDHDEVQLYLDTFNDKRRAYGFMINPRGIQYDYIWTDNNGDDGSWDTVWDSWGRVTPQGYVAMMAIPF